MKEEVRETPKDDALNTIIGDTFIEDSEEHEAKVAPIVESAIEDVDTEIDGYLTRRYAVPISPAPRVLSKFSRDIAVYNLYSRLGVDEGTEEKSYLDHYNAAVRFLTLIAEGKVLIGAEAENPTSTVATEFSVKSNPRILSQRSMRRM